MTEIEKITENYEMGLISHDEMMHQIIAEKTRDWCNRYKVKTAPLIAFTREEQEFLINLPR